jgi:hypothetical protein
MGSSFFDRPVRRQEKDASHQPCPLVTTAVRERHNTGLHRQVFEVEHFLSNSLKRSLGRVQAPDDSRPESMKSASVVQNI